VTIDIDAYLKRIGHAGSRAPTTDTLRSLQRAHLLAVPFENLDINPGGRPISLIVDSIFDKVVRRHRGGFCYELNGLFAVLLEELGYDVTRISGRVARGNGTFGPDFDHLALVVRTGDGAHLTDVGFGDFALGPLDLAVEGPQEPHPGGTTYRLDTLGDGEWVTRSLTDAGGWDDGYRFDLTPRELTAFAAQCRWFESAEDSHFRARRVCSIATENGRVTLRDAELIVTRGGAREITPISGEGGWTAALEKWFGIRLTAN